MHDAKQYPLPPQLPGQVDIHAELPYFMNPVLAACQMVNVSEPGKEPGLWEAKEDMRVWSPELADKNGEGPQGVVWRSVECRCMTSGAGHEH